MDFPVFEPEFTHGDPDLAESFRGGFSGPMRKAAFKELRGEVMVSVE